MRNKGLGKVKTLELRTLLRLGSGETGGSSSQWAGGWLLALVVLLLPKQFQRPRIRPEPSLRGPLAPDPHCLLPVSKDLTPLGGLTWVGSDGICPFVSGLLP